MINTELKEKNKHIVIINGTGGSGKDTFVEFASKYARVTNFSSIDLIKEIGSLNIYKMKVGYEWLAQYGWQGAKTEKDRKFLSELKKLWREYNNLPLVDTERAIITFLNSENEIMFIHIREPEEIQKTINIIGDGVTTLLIKREDINNIDSNESDKNVEQYNYDVTILNKNLGDLEHQAKLFVGELLAKENELAKK